MKEGGKGSQYEDQVIDFKRETLNKSYKKRQKNKTHNNGEMGTGECFHQKESQNKKGSNNK